MIRLDRADNGRAKTPYTHAHSIYIYIIYIYILYIYIYMNTQLSDDGYHFASCFCGVFNEDANCFKLLTNATE